MRRWPLSTLALALLLLAVQVDLWLGKGNLRYVWQLERAVAEQRAANDAARALNARIEAEVGDLVEGLEIVEERARQDLGMLRSDEILVQVAAGAPRPGPAPR
jgi:cell division protein FtsB